jgi:hypothetical protein
MLLQIFQYGEVFDKLEAPRSSYSGEDFLIKFPSDYTQSSFSSECSQPLLSLSFENICNEILRTLPVAIKYNDLLLNRFLTLCLENYNSKVNKSSFFFNREEFTTRIKNLEKTVAPQSQTKFHSKE